MGGSSTKHVERDRSVKEGWVDLIGEDGSPQRVWLVLKRNAMFVSSRDGFSIELSDIDQVLASDVQFIVATSREALLFKADRSQNLLWATAIKVRKEQHRSSDTFAQEPSCSVLESNASSAIFACPSCAIDDEELALCRNCSMICHEGHSITLLDPTKGHQICGCSLKAPLNCKLVSEKMLKASASRIALLERTQRLGLDPAEVVHILDSIPSLPDGTKDWKVVLDQLYVSSTEVDDVNICRKCRNNTIDSILMNCAHHVFCFACASGLKEKNLPCPFCNEMIVGIHRVYDA